jgi:serine protease Do
MRTRLLFVAMLFTAVAHAQEGEEAFRAAAAWTVQVRTAVSRPFIEDEFGTWFGAGLLVDAERGWILTNAHVAGHSYGKISIAFQDGHAVPARRIYVDPDLDLAVLSYDTRRLEPKTQLPVLDCSSRPPVGHPVGAFGHPWGFRFTGTRGITSAFTTRLGPNMLQTDAPINEGNSGGPLISLTTGRVVGINTAKIKEESVEGLSFAVPAPYACTVLELLRHGRDPSPPARLVDFARDENDEQTMIVARSRLAPGTLALQAGDEILGFAGTTNSFATTTDLFDAMRGHLDEVALRVRRAGRTIAVRGRWPAAARVIERRALWISGALFAEAEPVTLGLIAGVPSLMIHHVEPGSDAEAVGLSTYDLLVSANGSPVDSLDTLQARARLAAATDQPLELLLLRFTPETHDELFLYERRLLPVGDLETIGP